MISERKGNKNVKSNNPEYKEETTDEDYDSISIEDSVSESSYREESGEATSIDETENENNVEEESELTEESDETFINKSTDKNPCGITYTKRKLQRMFEKL